MKLRIEPTILPLLVLLLVFMQVRHADAQDRTPIQDRTPAQSVLPAERVALLPPDSLRMTPATDLLLHVRAGSNITEAGFLERLSALYAHQSDLMASIARGDDDAAVTAVEAAMRELGQLTVHEEFLEDPRFTQAYRTIVAEYERIYGPADTLFVAFGDIFELRSDMFAALEALEDPLLEDVVPQSLQPVGTTVPMTMNRLVENSMEFLLRERREVLLTWIQRADTYFPMVEEIFEEEGIPDELKYLSMIESGLNPRARSWAAAVGMWQFMAATGRAYDLNVNAWVDDRMDPELSTRAAARHLKWLYDFYDQDWHVALAGYNCSPRCIRRAERRARATGVSDPTYWDMYPYLPRETRNYVPMFIATSLIASNPQAYGLEPADSGPRYAYHVVPVTGMLDLDDVARLAGTDVATIKALNPSLRRNSLPPSTGAFHLRVPMGAQERFVAAYEALPPAARRPSGEYIVERGNTLSGIASEFGVSVAQIMQKNGLRSTRINIGQRLVVPIADYTTDLSTTQFAENRQTVQYGQRSVRPILLEATAPPAVVANNANTSSGRASDTPVRTVSTGSDSTDEDATESEAQSGPSAPENAPVRVSHRVRRGDTLSGIASAYSVRVSDVRSWNNISGSVIRVGQTLVIYTDGRRAASRESGEPVRYTVKRGDTLSEIAAAHGVPLSRVRTWNNIRGSNIRVGQKLLLYPEMAPSVTYTVRRGDTLIGIAGRHGVTVAKIKQWNSLSSNTIRPGDQLTIFNR